VKALKQTKRQYQVLYCGIRGQGVLNIYLFGFVLIPIPVQCVAVRLGAIIVPLLVLILNNKYINVSKSKAQLKLVSG
jgi:hypothetical protein